MSTLYIRVLVCGLGFVFGIILTAAASLSSNRFFAGQEILEGLLLLGGFLLGTVGGFWIGEQIERRFVHVSGRRDAEEHEEGGR